VESKNKRLPLYLHAEKWLTALGWTKDMPLKINETPTAT